MEDVIQNQAGSTKEEKEHFDERQVVVFKLGQEEFGVKIMEVKEIIRMESITRIPNTADYIQGVINLRGGIIVVINLAMKLGLPAKESDKNTRIIVIEINGSTVGMVVDSATEVLRISGENIKPAPSIITQKIDSSYLEGVGVIDERLLILLDLAKVLEDKDIEEVMSAQTKGSAANKDPSPSKENSISGTSQTNSAAEGTSRDIPVEESNSSGENPAFQEQKNPETENTSIPEVTDEAMEEKPETKSVKKSSSKKQSKKVVKKPSAKVSSKSAKNNKIKKISSAKSTPKTSSKKTVNKSNQKEKSKAAKKTAAKKASTKKSTSSQVSKKAAASKNKPSVKKSVSKKTGKKPASKKPAKPKKK
ncbi:MAG: chemotaxis protein CheW [Candidatus Woesearchaeota archaeon]